MLKLSPNHRRSLYRLAVVLLVLGALSFAAGPVSAQDHGSAGHGQEDLAHQQATHESTAHEAGTEHVAAEHATGEHGEGEHHGSTPHMKNLVTFIAPILPESVAAGLEAFIDPFFAFIIMGLISLFFINVSRNLKATNPGRAQMAAELLISGLYDMFRNVIGPSARRYTPFLGALFIYIWFNNLVGMVPGAHSATSVFNTTTFALGLMTFFFVQFWAIRLNGIGGFLHHLAGSPKTGMDWGFSILLFPLHLLGELIKPVSLALRLFGNIFGEDTLVATMVILGYIITKLIFGAGGFTAYLPGVPLQLPFYFLGLLSCTIQALVFTLLATVYIALWLPHEEEHGH